MCSVHHICTSALWLQEWYSSMSESLPFPPIVHSLATYSQEDKHEIYLNKNFFEVITNFPICCDHTLYDGNARPPNHHGVPWKLL